MPVGVIGWRAGIASGNSRLIVKVPFRIPVISLFYASLKTYAYMYLFVLISVLTLPILAFISFFSACLHSVLPACPLGAQSLKSTFMGIFLFFLSTNFFFHSLLSRMLRKSAKPFIKSYVYQKKLVAYIQLSLFYLLTVVVLDYTFRIENFSPRFLLLLCGDIETNPGSQTNSCFKFFHWNLNSICARGVLKFP